jgi:hypothetical protein
MPSLNRIPLSRFPADLLSVLLLPGAVIFYVAASMLPRYCRATVFALLGVAFIVVAIRLARSARSFVNWFFAALYLLIGIGTLYIAYMESTLFV